MLHGVTEAFPSLFSGKRSSKPHSKAYRDFKEKWGFIDSLYQAADEKVEKVGEIYQLYLSDFLQWMTYMNDKAEADKAEWDFHEQREKAKRGR